jgi:purine-binding chemotaxis protein CheW
MNHNAADQAAAMAAVNERRAPAPVHRGLLRERAARLARVPHAGDATDAFLALRFRLGGEIFVIEATHVMQVGVLRELAPLPGASAPLFGVTHWRGSVITVLDLRARLGVVTTGLTDLGRLVILDGESAVFAFLADAVLDMVRISARDVQPLHGGESRSSLLRGMTADGALVIDDAALRSVFEAVRNPAGTPARRMR